jgi:glycosyltransferase involved in cell wall biosynthesis
MLNILIVHNQYQQAGGEDTVVEAEALLLAEAGHTVNIWTVDNKDLGNGLTANFKAALSATYSTSNRIIAQNKIVELKPDIIHVHNFFPQISPSIYDACAAKGIPVVQTLHNYRLICPGALLMRKGKICELCVNGSPYQSAIYGCYRNSKLGSLAVAHMVAKHRRKQTWNTKVDRFIALTEFAKSKFVQSGFPSQKIIVKPNFVKPISLEGNTQKTTENYALYVGRLSEEKGISTLVNAWCKLGSNYKLKVAGDGPLRFLLESKQNIETLGFQSQAAVHQLMQDASFLILPSEWYEGFPMVLVEAFAHGLPAIASNLGSLAEIISHGDTGLLFEPGNAEDLANRIQSLLENQEDISRMGKNAQLIYQAKYTPELNIQLLMDIYQQAIQENSLNSQKSIY